MSSRVNMFVALAISLTSFMNTSIVSADGDISVSVRRGALRITGGRAASQYLKITATATANRYMLETNDGTTLNRAAGPMFVEGITGNTDIRLVSDESLLVLSEGIHFEIAFNNLSISTTSRTSSVLMLDAVVSRGNMSLTTGNGSDVVLLGRNGALGDVTIRTGSGDDSVFCYQNFIPEDLMVDGGSGNDILMFEATLNSVATFRGGSGNDLIGSKDPFSFGLADYEYDGGTGTDQYYHGAPFSHVTRRMEEPFPGTFDDMFDQARARDQFELSLLVWALLGLEG